LYPRDWLMSGAVRTSFTRFASGRDLTVLGTDSRRRTEAERSLRAMIDGRAG
jgi:hypothetical protein